MTTETAARKRRWSPLALLDALSLWILGPITFALSVIVIIITYFATRHDFDFTSMPDMALYALIGVPEFFIALTVAKLTREQAMYHFLSGYTAKLAGTERGVTEPKAAFSTCFGAPFLPLPPAVYAKMLGEKLEAMKAGR